MQATAHRGDAEARTPLREHSVLSFRRKPESSWTPAFAGVTEAVRSKSVSMSDAMLF